LQPEAIDKPEILSCFYKAGEGKYEDGCCGGAQELEGSDEAINHVHIKIWSFEDCLMEPVTTAEQAFQRHLQNYGFQVIRSIDENYYIKNKGL
jgi:hypothetical protein